MQVPFVHGPGDLRLGNVQPPHAGPRDVVIRVATAGICGSDLGYTAVGGLAGPTDQPMPLGHELSGTIVEFGEEVQGFASGDRVVLNPLFNMIGNGGPEGGFAELLLVRDVVSQPASLLRLPEHISFDVGALVEPLSVSLHAINRGEIKPGEKVAIYGAGPIGLGTIVALRRRGVDDIVVFDLSSFRRGRALKLGARAAIDPREQSPFEALGHLHGSTVLWGIAPAVCTDIFIEASGAPDLICEIIGYARFGARLVVVSVQKKPVEINFQILLGKEMSITTAMGYPAEFPDVLAMLSSGDIDVEPMVSHRFKGTDFMAAFATASRPDAAAKVLVQYSD
jgi:(R,R)-butanediol dehydrogenase/meso-butanediol dehydrogenase/diacetyl reductase